MQQINLVEPRASWWRVFEACRCCCLTRVEMQRTFRRHNGQCAVVSPLFPHPRFYRELVEIPVGIVVLGTLGSLLLTRQAPRKLPDVCIPLPALPLLLVPNASPTAKPPTRAALGSLSPFLPSRHVPLSLLGCSSGPGLLALPQSGWATQHAAGDSGQQHPPPVWPCLLGSCWAALLAL